MHLLSLVTDNQQKEEKDGKNYLMINLHKSMGTNIENLKYAAVSIGALFELILSVPVNNFSAKSG